MLYPREDHTFLDCTIFCQQFGPPWMYTDGGRSRRRFGLEPGYTNFNHGSYGSVPTDVMKHHRELLDRVETNPDRWYAHLPSPSRLFLGHKNGVHE